MTGAELIVQNLIKRNVDVVFGYIGGSVLDLFDSLRRNRGKIKLYTNASEQGACHSADGYARVSGKAGVVIATSGPGATNLVTGIATAYMDSVPLVLITGNVSKGLKGKDSFQEIDIIGVTMPVTKHNFMLTDADKLDDILDEAFEIALGGRPGPVLIDIPKDVFSAKISGEIGELLKMKYQGWGREKSVKNDEIVSCHSENFGEGLPQNKNNQILAEGGIKIPLNALPSSFRAGRGCKNSNFTISSNDLICAEELIKNSLKPFIYVGGGAVKSDAGAEIIRLSEKINAPIGASLMGLSAVPNDHSNYLGLIGMHGLFGSSEIMSEADLIIAVGTRFSDRATGDKDKFYRNRKVLHIDIDPSEIGKNIPAYFSLIGDARTILSRLNGGVSAREGGEWKARFTKIKEENEKSYDCGEGLSPRFIIEKLQNFTENSTVIATDVGQHQIWTAQYYKFYTPKTFLTAGGLGTMGYGMGGAIGAAVYSGKKTVLVTGDGSFLMNFNELATAVTYNIPLVVIIINNSALGMVKQWQEFFKKGKVFETAPKRKIDFAALAVAMGAKGYKIENKENAEEIFKAAFKEHLPVVIEVKISADEKVLPVIPPNKGLEDIILRG